MTLARKLTGLETIVAARAEATVPKFPEMGAVSDC